MKHLMEASKRILRGEQSVNEVEGNDDTQYNKVFRAMAKHFDVDPEKVDELSDEKKKEFYDTLDKCYDENEDEIPKNCPVDLQQYIGEAVDDDDDVPERLSEKQLKDAIQLAKREQMIFVHLQETIGEIAPDIIGRGMFHPVDEAQIKFAVLSNAYEQAQEDLEDLKREFGERSRFL